MSLASQLSSVYDSFLKNAPEPVVQTIVKSKTDLKASFNPSSAIQVGDTLPEFCLSDATGKEVTSVSLLATGPLLITFYRGTWCPFCNLAIRALQSHLDDFKAKGVTIVAISPELPDTSLSGVEKNALQFPVLSDVGNQLSRKLGIVWAQPDTLRPLFEQFGHDLKTRNGDDTLEVPIPTTLLVDKKGTIRNIFLDPDYTKRLEPSVALEWINEL